jgi:uncharacterized protein (TIGR02300 family)
MATKQARGTKRTCQSSECDARFYDLDRDPIVCPICGSVYELATSPVVAAAVAEDRAQLKPKKPELATNSASGDADAETEDDLPEIADEEEDGGTEIASNDDATFLEDEEEEGSDVSNIIGTPVKKGEEER